MTVTLMILWVEKIIILCSSFKEKTKNLTAQYMCQWGGGKGRQMKDSKINLFLCG